MEFKKDKMLYGFTLAALVFFLALFFAFTAKDLSARLSVPQTETYVEIDGVGYGIFNEINNLRDLMNAGPSKDSSFTKVSLRRHFVTDPSLSLWARNSFHVGDGLKDIRLVIKTKEGKQEISRYVLKLCKPLSWTVEAADPSQGGFHEKIEFAVQEIAVY